MWFSPYPEPITIHYLCKHYSPTSYPPQKVTEIKLLIACLYFFISFLQVPKPLEKDRLKHVCFSSALGLSFPVLSLSIICASLLSELTPEPTNQLGQLWSRSHPPKQRFQVGFILAEMPLRDRRLISKISCRCCFGWGGFFDHIVSFCWPYCQLTALLWHCLSFSDCCCTVGMVMQSYF